DLAMESEARPALCPESRPGTQSPARRIDDTRHLRSGAGIAWRATAAPRIWRAAPPCRSRRTLRGAPSVRGTPRGDGRGMTGAAHGETQAAAKILWLHNYNRRSIGMFMWDIF